MLIVLVYLGFFTLLDIVFETSSPFLISRILLFIVNVVAIVYFIVKYIRITRIME